VYAHQSAGRTDGSRSHTRPFLAAVMNAVMDALASTGVKHFDMPASPHRVWSAIQAAKHA